MDITYLTITPDGTIAQQVGPMDMKTAQGIVGGNIHVFTPHGYSVTVIAKEDGKSDGLNPNWLATNLLRSRLRPSDFIVGVVIVTGPQDEVGDPTSLDVQSEEAIRRLAEK